MKVLLYEMGTYFCDIVLWDGEYTYWSDQMFPSGGYKSMRLDETCAITHGRFTLIGDL